MTNQLGHSDKRLHDDNRRLSECWTAEQEAHQQTQAENERLRAELADALCASCKHPWRYHTSGGMCAGSAEYIECYCVMISPL